MPLLNDHIRLIPANGFDTRWILRVWRRKRFKQNPATDSTYSSNEKKERKKENNRNQVQCVLNELEKCKNDIATSSDSFYGCNEPNVVRHVFIFNITRWLLVDNPDSWVSQNKVHTNAHSIRNKQRIHTQNPVYQRLNGKVTHRPYVCELTHIHIYI